MVTKRTRSARHAARVPAEAAIAFKTAHELREHYAACTARDGCLECERHIKALADVAVALRWPPWRPHPSEVNCAWNPGPDEPGFRRADYIAAQDTRAALLEAAGLPGDE